MFIEILIILYLVSILSFKTNELDNQLIYPIEFDNYIINNMSFEINRRKCPN